MDKTETTDTKEELVTLKLGADALNQGVLDFVGDGKIGWTPSDHEKLGMALIDQLTGKDGKPPILNESIRERLSLVFRYAVDTQTKVLVTAFAEAGYQLDKAARNALAVLFVPATFADKLAKKKNPKTGRPFITKEPRAKRSRGFDDFIDAAE